MTGSPLSGTKYPHKWLKYIEMMVAGLSLRTIAKELKIHLSTAVNSYHRRLKDWMLGFNGVATKYLNGYLIWHRFLELNKKIPSKENRDEMLLNACKKANFTTVNEIRYF